MRSLPSLRDRLKAIPAPLQLLRNVQSGVRLHLVRLLSPGQQRCNLFPQLLLQLVRVVPAHRLVLAGIRLDLGAVQTHIPEVQHPQRPRHHQDLGEQATQAPNKPLAKGCDRVVIGMQVRRDEAECNRLVRRPLQLAA